MAVLPMSSAHVEQRLTNLAQKYINLNFIGEEFFPTIPVAKESDKFVVFGAENTDIIEAGRVLSGNTNRITMSLSDTTYNCEEKAVEVPIDWRLIANQDVMVNLKQNATYTAMDLLKLAREYAIVSAITSTSNVTNYTDLSTATYGQWNDNSSDPFGAINTGIASIRDSVGQLPNRLGISHAAYLNLKEHPAVIAKLGANERGVIGADRRCPILEDLFGIEKVFVGSGIYNTANKGQDPDFSQIWGTTAILAYVAPNPGLNAPSFGYGFQSRNYQVSSYDSNDIKSLVVGVSDIRDDKICNESAAYLFTNAYA